MELWRPDRFGLGWHPRYKGRSRKPDRCRDVNLCKLRWILHGRSIVKCGKKWWDRRGKSWWKSKEYSPIHASCQDDRYCRSRKWGQWTDGYIRWLYGTEAGCLCGSWPEPEERKLWYFSTSGCSVRDSQRINCTVKEWRTETAACTWEDTSASGDRT